MQSPFAPFGRPTCALSGITQIILPSIEHSMPHSCFGPRKRYSLTTSVAHISRKKETDREGNQPLNWPPTQFKREKNPPHTRRCCVFFFFSQRLGTKKPLGEISRMRRTSLPFLPSPLPFPPSFARGREGGEFVARKPNVSSDHTGALPFFLLYLPYIETCRGFLLFFCCFFAPAALLSNCGRNPSFSSRFSFFLFC